MSDETSIQPSGHDSRLVPAVADAAKDLTAAAGEEVREIAALASGQAKTLKEKIVDSGGEIRDWAAEGAESIKRAAREDAQAMRESIGQRTRQAREGAERFESGVENYIREQPLKSVAIAAAAGFLLGRITRH